MLSTYASYNLVANNLQRSLATTAAQPVVARETQYYEAHIGDIKTVDDFMNNSRIFNYAMKAYGLEDMSYAKAMIRQVLEGGIDDSSALANKLSDPRFKALATAFNFTRFGAATTTTTAVQTDTVNKYLEQTLEVSTGQQSEGARLALYFQRMAPQITDAYSILGDPALLKVVQTALNISPLTSSQDITTQASTINSVLNISDLQDPAKLQRFIQKFSATYDANNFDPASDPILGLFNSSTTVTMSVDLMMSIQTLKLGGS
jgi:Protein of unknown function (DUF1217)